MLCGVVRERCRKGEKLKCERDEKLEILWEAEISTSFVNVESEIGKNFFEMKIRIFWHNVGKGDLFECVRIIKFLVQLTQI